MKASKPGRKLLIGEREWCPHLRASGKVESFRHHSYHRRWVPVHVDRPADNARIRFKGSLPNCVAEHDHVVVARLAFLSGESSPELRRHAEYSEELGGRRCAGDSLG
jgi:hypothetical protein